MSNYMAFQVPGTHIFTQHNREQSLTNHSWDPRLQSRTFGGQHNFLPGLLQIMCMIPRIWTFQLHRTVTVRARTKGRTPEKCAVHWDGFLGETVNLYQYFIAITCVGDGMKWPPHVRVQIITLLFIFPSSLFVSGHYKSMKEKWEVTEINGSVINMQSY